MGLATGLAHSGDQRLDRPYEPTHIIGYAYDGTRSNRSDLLIDGAPSTSTANANEVIASYVPPSDLVQEFKVQTATFDAQFGNTEGGVTSMSIKSGTNRCHGSVYYFAEPKSLARERLLRERARPGAPGHLLEPARLQPHRPGPHPGPLRRGGQDLLHGRLRAHQGRSPALRRPGRLVGPDRGAAKRRLLRVLVEHHDLRSADPRPQPATGSTSGSRSPATSSRPNRISPVSRGDPGVLLACRRAPASPATSTTRRCRRRPTTPPSRPASTRRSRTPTRCSSGTAGTTATATTTSTWTRRPRAPGSSSSRTRP